MLAVGIDEVGRGCWAGPVVASAVILDGHVDIAGLNDSKKLSRAQRERLAIIIHEQAVAVGIGWVWPEEIDRMGLTASVAKAMQLAVRQIKITYDEIIIDGTYNFLTGYAHVRTMAGADALVPAVSAASIVAKVARDDYMRGEAARQYPQYGFDRHVGYGTPLHLKMLLQHGVTKIHRKSYKPVHQFLVQSDA